MDPSEDLRSARDEKLDVAANSSASFSSWVTEEGEARSKGPGRVSSYSTDSGARRADGRETRLPEPLSRRGLQINASPVSEGRSSRYSKERFTSRA